MFLLRVGADQKTHGLWERGCTIFASLARANERVHVHKERNFRQAKLDCEINAGFLLYGWSDLYFLLHNNSVHIVLLYLKKIKKKLIGRKEKI